MNEEEKNQLVDITEEEAMSINHSFEINLVPSEEDDDGDFSVTMKISGDPMIIGEGIVDCLMEKQDNFLELLMNAMADRLRNTLMRQVMDRIYKEEDIN